MVTLSALIMNHTVVDHGSEFSRWDIFQHLCEPVNSQAFRAEASARTRQVPPSALPYDTATSLPVKLAETCLNKSKRAVFCVDYTPDGRRILSGTMNGEFTLWHGMNFNLEMVMQAHENAVRCMKYSHAGEWLISGDQDGLLKVWQPNFNNVKMQRAHSEVMRDIAWSPNDSKFATCSDDGSVKVWSFASMTEETSFSGRNAHGWDVKCVDWHPSMALLASGSKDNTLRLWDPRQKSSIYTIHEFKNTVSRARFQPTGNQFLLAASSRDHTAHVFDIRKIVTNGESQVLRGHNSDVACLEWHPVHRNMLTTATHEGSLHHFVLDSASMVNDVGQLMPAWTVPKAHQWPVWDLAYHPAGHALATGSNDKTVRIWTRAAPGDHLEDIKNPEVYATADEFAGVVAPKKTKKSAPTGIPGLPTQSDEDSALEVEDGQDDKNYLGEQVEGEQVEDPNARADTAAEPEISA